MKKLVVIIIVLLLGVGLYYLIPKENIKKSFKHRISSSVGLKRLIEEQDCNRQTVNSWQGRFKVEVTQSGISFINEADLEVKLSPPYKVTEID